MARQVRGLSQRPDTIQPYSGHESRKSHEIYSKLSLSECQDEYEAKIKDFPV